MPPDRKTPMDELSDYIFDSLLEECVWKTAILEHKRARNYRAFLDQQEAHAAEKKGPNEKHSNDANVDCPVCARDISATRFAPHLTKCLKLGGRGQATKKTVASDMSKVGSLPSSDNQNSQISALQIAKKLAAENNPKKRGRPKKSHSGPTSAETDAIRGRPKKATSSLTPAETDAMLSNAINNATQRLNLKQLMGTQASTSSTNPSARPSISPHPLSQSHVANPASLSTEHGVPPPPKVTLKRKKKPGSHEVRSKHSSQASSSSDSDDDMDVQEEEYEEEEEQDDDHEPDGENDERLRPDQEGDDCRVDPDDPTGNHEGRGQQDLAQDDSRTTGVSSPVARTASVEISTLPRPAPTSASLNAGTAPTRDQIILARPPLKRKSSSQADSTDEDSD
ncbi:hypothetical protein CROQUDRAFT_654359 [Cronartium quercuum f. sp. fusiforme G11]|uniref:SAGA-associated factor 11 n=1 Tax=Cronartium quercuum f. sp. fusiforme G11 TaxID=708437 RepID=A0A9P6NR84_9BASI|nr:hypothetical protein CROQUDRAFT_654359 [Cronartium quercuum f. sp. fusiforme G11]